MQVNGRVLSVQSSVVSGYVGNKAAVFPLQLLGFEVDVVNSVQFSNHTGYKNKWTGKVMSGDDLVELVEGMKGNNLIRQISHMLTGYVGNASFLRAILKTREMIMAENPDLLFVCDPVLGDNGKFYTPVELLDVYKEEVLPRADILTPNAFELGVLSGEEDSWGSVPRSRKEMFDSIAKLHDLGCPKIVVTSSVSSETDCIVAYASCIHSVGSREMYSFEIEPVRERFTGSGDLTAALLLGHLTGSDKKPLKEACEVAFSTAMAILKATAEVKRGDGLTDMPEVQLISSQGLIRDPPALVKATAYEP